MNVFNRRSLAQQYVFFAVILPLVLLVMATITSAISYFNAKNIQALEYESEAQRMAETFSTPLEYLNRFTTLIGKEIARTDYNDPQAVVDAMRKHVEAASLSQKVYAWTVFTFVDRHNRMIAQSEDGVLKETRSLKRDFLKTTPVRPWEFILDPPDIGYISGEWIIPAGIGVTNSKGEYIGAITLGISVSNLLANIDKFLATPSTEFIVLTDEGNILLYSATGLAGIERNFFKDKLNAIPKGGAVFGKLNQNLELNNIQYSHYRKLENYPYTILYGKNLLQIKQEFRRIIYPQIIQSLVIATLVMLLLLFFSRRVIKPLIRLSDAADKLSKGDVNVQIPRTRTYETFILAKQLIHVQRYIKKIKRIDKKLIQATKDAQAASRAKSEFLANMSHELRTPLNAIIGYSEMIRNELFGPIYHDKYREYVHDICDSGKHLLGLINSILDISKIEDQQLVIKSNELEVEHIIEKCVQIASVDTSKSNINIVTDIQSDLPILFADELRIKQIIINILSNAVKFSHENGTIWIKAFSNEEGLNICIEDEGIGISEENLPHVFDKFKQVDSSLARTAEGTGLGLWLTKQLVEAHQGKMHIASSLGSGTKVTITFPPERRLSRDH